MGFGKLDRRIVIQSGTETVTSNGERTESWTTFHTCWAGLDYGAGDEEYDAGQLTALNEIAFKIRYKSGVLAKMRVSYDSFYYDILHVTEVDRQRYLIIKATKRD
jgi:SPP1 family predicted phage head-tail adaptor